MRPEAAQRHHAVHDLLLPDRHYRLHAAALPVDALLLLQREQGRVRLPHPVDPRKPPLAELCGHLDRDPPADLHQEHRQDHHRGHPAAAVHLVLCGLRLRQDAVQGQERPVPGLHRHHRGALAGLHGAPVHDDELLGTEQHPPGHHVPAGVQRLRRLFDEAVL